MRFFTDKSKLAGRIGGEVHCRELSISFSFRLPLAFSKLMSKLLWVIGHSGIAGKLNCKPDEPARTDKL